MPRKAMTTTAFALPAILCCLVVTAGLAETRPPSEPGGSKRSPPAIGPIGTSISQLAEATGAQLQVQLSSVVSLATTPGVDPSDLQSGLIQMRELAATLPIDDEAEVRHSIVAIQTSVLGRAPETVLTQHEAEIVRSDAAAHVSVADDRAASAGDERIGAKIVVYAELESARLLQAAGLHDEAAVAFESLSSDMAALSDGTLASFRVLAPDFPLQYAAASRIAAGRPDAAVATLARINTIDKRRKPANFHALAAAGNAGLTFPGEFAQAWLDAQPWDEYTPEFLVRHLASMPASGADLAAPALGAFRKLMSEHRDLIAASDTMAKENLERAGYDVSAGWCASPSTANLLIAAFEAERRLGDHTEAGALADDILTQFPDHPSAPGIAAWRFHERSAK